MSLREGMEGNAKEPTPTFSDSEIRQAFAAASSEEAYENYEGLSGDVQKLCLAPTFRRQTIVPHSSISGKGLHDHHETLDPPNSWKRLTFVFCDDQLTIHVANDRAFKFLPNGCH